jgi:MtN3 and saliva related transmembrane protein
VRGSGLSGRTANRGGMVETIGWLAACLTTLSFVPQVHLAMRTRDLSGISIPMYVSFCLGVALWLIYGIYKNSLPVIGANAVTLALALVVLILTIRYHRTNSLNET